MKKIILILKLFFLFLFGYSQGWIEQESKTDFNLTDVFFTTPNSGIVVGVKGTLLKTIDGGSNWENISIKTNNDLLSIHFIDSLVGFTISAKELFKTTDGGNSWTLQDTANYLSKIFFIGQDTGFVVGYNRFLFTCDKGVTWTKSNFNKMTIHSFWALDSHDLLIGAGSGIIIKSTDQGASWNLVNQSAWPIYIEDIHFFDKYSGIAIGGGFAQGYTNGVMQTTVDGGLEWMHSNKNYLQGKWLKSLAFTDNTGYAVGFEGNILKTTDNGKNWITQQTDKDYSLSSVYFTDSLIGYTVGSNGTILKTMDGGINQTAKQPLNDFIDYNFNQTSNQLQITLNKNSIHYSRVFIYDLKGRIIMQSNFMNSSTSIDLTTLNYGLYVVKVINNNDITTFKIIKN